MWHKVARGFVGAAVVFAALPFSFGPAIGEASPDGPDRGESPELSRQVPRHYPVDQATFGLMKAQANAAAAQTPPGGGSGVG